MRQIANDKNRFRFRLERRAGLRGLDRAIISRAAPRNTSSGDQAQGSKGGGGVSTTFGNLTGGLGIDTGIIDVGDPVTGSRTAMWGFFAWDSTLDCFGA